MTNIIGFPGNSAVKETAAEWLVKIDRGPLSGVEKKKLKKWLGQNSEHRAVLLNMAKLWGELEVVKVLADLYPLPEEMRNEMEDSRPSHIQPRRKQPKFLAAAMIATLFIAGFLFTRYDDLLTNAFGTQSNEDVYTTEVGEQSEIVLSDGSRINLNTHTQVRVKYTDEERAIYLDRGEGFFNVAKNPELPFMVYAGSGVIKAHGTAFNVRVEKNKQVDVILTEGVIEVVADAENYPVGGAAFQGNSNVRPKDSAILDQKGASVSFDKARVQVTHIPEDRLESKLSWKSGKWLFRDESLAEVMAEVGRYTNQQIRITDPAINDLKIAGYFDLGELEPLLEAMQEGLGVKVTRVDNKVIELSRADVED